MTTQLRQFQLPLSVMHVMLHGLSSLSRGCVVLHCVDALFREH